MTTSPSRNPPLIGRAPEQEQLAEALASSRPELIAIHGRRRIGKTYLVRSFFSQELCFEMTGVCDAPLSGQLRNFANQLKQATGFNLAAPRDWPEAFQALITYLNPCLKTGGRKVVFFDELPWLAGRKSGFLPAFDHFWNTWGTKQSNLIVVICGSAASWMIAKVLKHKGGLHNRITRSIHLPPFGLPEIADYLKANGVALDHKQTVEIAMAIGGVPFYLNHVRKGWSAAQNIQSLFFAPHAPLRGEFDQVFAALFEKHERHLQVVRALARRQSGLRRLEIIAATKLESGGALTTVLDELEASGFICRLTPFGETTRDSCFRLIDELTLFHLRWVEGQGARGASTDWPSRRLAPSGMAWSGYAFENICLRHSAQIKQALGIAGVQAAVCSWRHQAKGKDDTGAQIDLLFDRADGVISVCEMKFSEQEFVIDKAYSNDLRSKLGVFRRVTGTRKTLFLVMVSAHGLKANEYQASLVQNVVPLAALFAP